MLGLVFCHDIFWNGISFEPENELAKPEVLETPKGGAGLKWQPPKIGSRFNYNNQSVSCA